jgi:hypothetical protein
MCVESVPKTVERQRDIRLFVLVVSLFLCNQRQIVEFEKYSGSPLDPCMKLRGPAGFVSNNNGRFANGQFAISPGFGLAAYEFEVPVVVRLGL